MRKTITGKGLAAWVAAVAFAVFVPSAARADQFERLSWLTRAAARPAGMGGAFTAVPGDPAAMFINPSAAAWSNRLSISGTHSLRHFPHGKKNLDQFDADTVGATIPLANDHVLGLGFTIPGEWGIDYSDTNGLLNREKATPDGSVPDRPERLRGRERRVSLSDIRTNNGRGLGSAEIASNWYRNENLGGAAPVREFQRGGGFSFFYQDEEGFSYGVNIRLIKRKKAGEKGCNQQAVSVTAGSAYRRLPTADTLAAADIEAVFGGGAPEFRWYAGIERKSRDNIFARAGLMNGSVTYGAGARMSHLRLDYAVVRGLLPRVAGEDPGRFDDGHFLSYTITD